MQARLRLRYEFAQKIFTVPTRTYETFLKVTVSIMQMLSGHCSYSAKFHGRLKQIKLVRSSLPLEPSDRLSKPLCLIGFRQKVVIQTSPKSAQKLRQMIWWCHLWTAPVLQGQCRLLLCRSKLTPLSQCSGAVQFEIGS